MSYSRPLLIPWLRTQIDSKRYPGVDWTNPENTEFSVPWKHALRQDSSDSDVLIFKAWAEASGNGRAHGDPSIWKRNFRSALRAKGFTAVSDNKNDAANPHKIFRWPEESGSKATTSSSSDQDNSPELFDYPLSTQETQPCAPVFIPQNDVFSDRAPKYDILQECLEGLNIREGFEPPPEQQRRLDEAVIGGHVLPGQPQYPVACEGAGHEAGLPGRPAQPMEGAVGGAYNQQLVDQFLYKMSQTNDGNHFKTHFNVKVHYRGKLQFEQLIENESGVRIVYRPDLVCPFVDPDSGLTVISLPNPEHIIDQTQANLTQTILNQLGGGLDVGVSGHVVYGHRHGIKVFWSFSNFDESRAPQEVSKLQPEQLYQFKDFIKGISQFIEGRKESPHCSLFFCFGEKWPDPDNRPWHKKLITVEVVLTSMELLKNIAVEGGASSLQSVELQISLEEMMDLV